MTFDVANENINFDEIIPCSSLRWPTILTKATYFNYHVICFNIKDIGNRNHWFLVPDKLSPEKAIYESCLRVKASHLVRGVWSVLLNIDTCVAGEEDIIPITIYYPVWDRK